MTNNITIATIAELLNDTMMLTQPIDSDDDPPASTAERIILALDMMIDDAHDCEPADIDPTYPYALPEPDLIALRDMLHLPD